MFDPVRNPNDESVVPLNPYEVPRMLWDLIEEYFENQYDGGLEVAQRYPQKPVDRPTIAWRILTRRAGGGKDNVRQGAGASFTRYLKPFQERDGNIIEVHTQTQTVIYEFAVFGVSNKQADDIAWAVERALLQTEGYIKEQYPGFTMIFVQQTGDSTLVWRHQDELMVRTIQFKANVPIEYTVVKPTIRHLHVLANIGPITESKTLVRETSSDQYFISVPENKVVVGINFITLNASGINGYPEKILRKGIDYVVRESDNPLTFKQRYIVWNDDYGLVPRVGEQFRVTYVLTQKLSGLRKASSEEF